MDITKAQEIFDRYSDNFKSLNAYIYSQSPAEDLTLLRWWIHLSETGDINDLILPEARRLSPFLRVFRFPTALIYTLDSTDSISNAFWAAPVDGESTHRAAYCGAWSHFNSRGKRHQYNFIHLAYTFAFEFYDALLGMTWQPNLLDLHQKLGYSTVGCIPHLYDEDFLYIVHLTRDAFNNSRFAKIRRRQ